MKGRRQKRYDWGPIRKAREITGKSYQDLAKEFGPNRDTIRLRARREKWLDPAEAQRKLSEASTEEISRRFVAQEADALFANRARVHGLNSRVLDQVDAQLKLFEANDRATRLDSDDLLALRRISLIINTIEGSDAKVGGIEAGGGDFRSAGEAADEAESTADKISRILAELGD